MEKLVEYKKQKMEMERQLLGRFQAVLNSKKEYIQQLEDRLLGTDSKGRTANLSPCLSY
jgi:hypothetical protein